jgi:hypothetical protein
MSSTYRDTTPVEGRSKRGTGSLRERSPGVWEIRVVVGFDPGNGRSCQRSFSVHGDAEYAQRRRRELVDLWGVSRVAITSEGARLTTADLLDRYRRAPHLWKPATMISHASVLKALVADPIGRRRLINLTAGDVRAAISRWQAEDLSVATVSGRWWSCTPRCRGRSPRNSCGRTHWRVCAARLGPNRVVTTAWPRCASYSATQNKRWNELRPSLLGSPRRLGGCARCSVPNRTCRWCGWPPTAEPAVVSWLCYASEMSTGACLASSGACPTVCSDPRSRPARDA